MLQKTQQLSQFGLLLMNLLTQGGAIDEFHRDEIHTLALTDFINVRDVWVVKRSSGLCFLFEPPHAIFIRSEFSRQDLQSDFAMQARVFSKIHFTHPATPIFERISYRPSFVPVSAAII